VCLACHLTAATCFLVTEQEVKEQEETKEQLMRVQGNLKNCRLRYSTYFNHYNVSLGSRANPQLIAQLCLTQVSTQAAQSECTARLAPQVSVKVPCHAGPAGLAKGALAQLTGLLQAECVQLQG